MSLLDLARSKPVKFVIPTSGKCAKVRLENKTKAMVFVLNKGYIEAHDLESCYYVSVLLQAFGFKLVGKIDKIHMNSGGITYRQRIVFNSLEKLIKALQMIDVTVEVTNKFQITAGVFQNVMSDLYYLDKYSKQIDTSINVWLTDSCKSLLSHLLDEHDIAHKIEITDEFYNETWLKRSPQLLLGYNKRKRMGYSYTIDDSYGFTDRNIQRDMREGVFDNDY